MTDILGFVRITNKTQNSMIYEGIPFEPNTTVEIDDDTQILDLIKVDEFREKILDESIEIQNELQQIIDPQDAIDCFLGVNDDSGGPGSIIAYGSFFKMKKKNPVEVKTTSTIWHPRVSLVSSLLPPGLYEITAETDYSYDTTSRDLLVRIRQNNTKTLKTKRLEQKESAGSNWKNTGTNQSPSWFTTIHLNLQGTHTFTLDFKPEASGDEASLWNSKLTLKYVGTPLPVGEDDVDLESGPGDI